MDKKLIAALSKILIYILFLITAVNLSEPDSPYAFFPSIMLLYSPLSLILNYSFINNGRKKKAIAALNIITIALFSSLILLKEECELSSAIVIILILFLFAVLSIRFLLSGNTRLLRLFDLTIIIFFLSSLICINYSYDPILIVPLIFACLISLTANAYLNGRTLIALIFASIILFLTFLLFSGGSGQLNSLTLLLWSSIKKLSSALMQLINKLLSLIPHLNLSISSSNVNFESEAVKRDDVFIKTMDPALFKIIIILSLAIAIFVFAYITLKLVKRDNKSRNSKSSYWKKFALLKSLKRCLKRLKKSISDFIYIQKHKNNIKGIYFYIVRAVKNTELAKRKEESPREFLMRLEGRSGIEFGNLTNEIELYFYSKDNNQKMPSNFKRIRKEIMFKKWQLIIFKIVAFAKNLKQKTI